MHPPPSPAQTNFTPMTECTRESRRYYSVNSVVVSTEVEGRRELSQRDFSEGEGCLRKNALVDLTLVCSCQGSRSHKHFHASFSATLAPLNLTRHRRVASTTVVVSREEKQIMERMRIYAN